jgi:hypothetical protein
VTARSPGSATPGGACLVDGARPAFAITACHHHVLWYLRNGAPPMAAFGAGGRGWTSIAGTLFLVVAILQLLAVMNAAAAAPKRILLLSSFGRDFEPWAEYRRILRAELERKSPEPIEFQDASLETERFGNRPSLRSSVCQSQAA